MKFSVFQVSRKGGRKNNEDRMGYCYTRGSAVFVLADGMGGHPDGEVAAQMALQSVANVFQKEAKPELPDVNAFLTNAVLAAHRQILRYGLDQAMLDSPRTTIVLAVVQGGATSWSHCGDSRLYLLRVGRVLTRTRDHSVLEQQLGKKVTPGATEMSNRNVLFTCLGSPAKPVFSITGPLALQQGDRVMLCSDGLWSSLSEDDIVFELGNKPVDVAVPDMVEKALRLGGASCDNVTCIAMAWETPDVQEAPAGNVTTETVNGDFFASTVQLGWMEAEAEQGDLDDAAIARSIAEINEAIRRSTKKVA